MASSIEPEFNPPDDLSRAEVIEMARRYINYWKIEAGSWQYKWQWMCDEHDRQAVTIKTLLEMKWQPIETAPLKKRVIVLLSDGEISTMFFDDAKYFKTTYGTHWMPIPKLPTQKSVE